MKPLHPPASSLVAPAASATAHSADSAARATPEGAPGPVRLEGSGQSGDALVGYTAYLGGSFDPGHYGHVAGGVALLRQGAEALWLAPTHVHADKNNSCPFGLRLVQCQAVADEIDRRLPQHLRGRVSVSDVEAHVDSDGQTARLFAHLTARHPGRKFAFAMGSDCLAKAPSWEGWEALQRMVRIVVFDRPGYPGAHEDLLADKMPEVSSTAIRRALGAGTPPSALQGLMPPAVAALVDSCNLYGAARAASTAADGPGAPPMSVAAPRTTASHRGRVAGAGGQAAGDACPGAPDATPASAGGNATADRRPRP